MAEMSGFIMSPSAMSVAIAETIDGAAAVFLGHAAVVAEQVTDLRVDAAFEG